MKSKKMKVVVFGGSGFLGSHVADILTEKGYEVVIYDIEESKYLKLNQKMIIGDILDYEKILKTLKDVSVVYHFAGIADINEAQLNPIETVKQNILGTTYILEACREQKVKRVMFASTVYVYSELGGFYRSSKQACELLIENYQHTYGLDYTILRYGSLYGRRANKFNFINQIITEALVEKKIHRKGDGSEIRSYINVRDAAMASVELISDDYKNKYIIINGTQSYHVKDILNMIREILSKEIEIEYLDEKNEFHYEITPYSFRPRVATKYVLKNYHDLGQGILDCIYDVYKQLSKSQDKDILDIELPESIEY